jgi:drug/metabolite transporter (DMT)-like permease
MLYLIVTSLVWAFSYGLIKSNLYNLDPSLVTSLRMLCALLVFAPFLRPKIISKRQALQLMFIGAIQYGVMYLCFLRSFQYLDAYQVALFTIFTPLYVILINAVLERKFHRYYMKVALMAVSGGAVIYFNTIKQTHIFTGFVLVQCSDLCFAYGQVAYKRLRQQALEIRDAQIYSLLFIGAFITAALATTASSGWHGMLDITLSQMLVIIYLGTIASGICFFLWNKGATMTDTATLAVFNNLKSPLAITVSLVFFKEHTNILRLIVGLLVIFLALIMAEHYAKPSRKPIVATA